MSSPTPCVLFVDDEPSILSALRRLVRPLGGQVLLAESGRAGLELLGQNEVDLVVSDMRMPEMDGAAFLEQVRQRWPQVQRMLLTGYADINSTIAAINRGEIHRYIAKPWDDQDLLLAVRDGIQRRRLEQENHRLQALTQQQNAELQDHNGRLERQVAARTAELEQVNGMLEAAYAELENSFLLSMDVFAGLLELREHGAAGHSREVARLAQRVARQLRLPPRDVQDTYIAGLLHEIGRMSLPDALLRKPQSSMTAEELARYRRHPLAAEAALLPLGPLQRVAKIVRALFERVDGHGQPDGLRGAELSMPAQVLALCSEFLGLVNGRHAERRYGRAETLALVSKLAGTHFGVEALQALREVIEAGPAPDETDQCITIDELRPGMVLARDLCTERGTLLLAAGFRFEPQVVRKIQELVQRERMNLSLYVQRAAAPAAPATA